MGNKETEAQRYQVVRQEGAQAGAAPGKPKLSFPHMVASSTVLPHLPSTLVAQNPPLLFLLHLVSFAEGPTLQDDLLVSPPHPRPLGLPSPARCPEECNQFS